MNNTARDNIVAMFTAITARLTGKARLNLAIENPEDMPGRLYQVTGTIGSRTFDTPKLKAGDMLVTLWTLSEMLAGLGYKLPAGVMSPDITADRLAVLRGEEAKEDVPHVRLTRDIKNPVKATDADGAVWLRWDRDATCGTCRKYHRGYWWKSGGGDTPRCDNCVELVEPEGPIELIQYTEWGDYVDGDGHVWHAWYGPFTCKRCGKGSEDGWKEAEKDARHVYCAYSCVNFFRPWEVAMEDKEGGA